MDHEGYRRQAALIRALARCRGLLYGVRSGEADCDEIDHVLAETSLAHLAEQLQLSEDELDRESDGAT